jgi:hypothetical protein
MPNKVSIRPSTFVEGGAPVDKKLTWKEARFANFDYTRKDGTVVASTVAARITYLDDEGTEYIQHYSVGDKERFQPSEDGKTLVAQGSALALSKSSNYYVLMSALINSGFPEDKLMDDDISVLDGLYTYNIGVPEPKRSSLKREEPDPASGSRERIISVPSQILRLPWEKEKKGAANAPKSAAKTPAAASEINVSEVVTFITDMLGEDDSTTRQLVATKAIREKKPAIAKLVFTKSDDFQVALLSAGLSLDGETITKS